MRKSTPYILLIPALLFTAFVLVYPLVQNLINSVSAVSMISGNAGWAGLDNYSRVFKNPLFWLAFRNTAIYAIAGGASMLCILRRCGAPVLAVAPENLRSFRFVLFPGDPCRRRSWPLRRC